MRLLKGLWYVRASPVSKIPGKMYLWNPTLCGVNLLCGRRERQNERENVREFTLQQFTDESLNASLWESLGFNGGEHE